MATTTTKTGRNRVRLGKERGLFAPKEVLVLQLEWRKMGYEPHPAYDYGREVDYTFWKDATVEDLTDEDLLL